MQQLPLFPIAYADYGKATLLAKMIYSNMISRKFQSINLEPVTLAHYKGVVTGLRPYEDLNLKLPFRQKGALSI